MTRSQSASASKDSAGVILASARLRSSSLMVFLATCRDRLPLMVAIADFNRSAETSFSTTSRPASPATCAMPLPIWPEPITPTFLIIIVILPSTRTARSSHLPTKHNSGRSLLFRPVPRSLFSELAELFCQFGNRLIEIGDQAIVGDLEDRGILIL